MRFLKKLISGLLLITLLLSPEGAFAAQFGLIAPSGQLSRGQEIQFTITIDTQGSPVTTTQIGVSYLTQYVQYLSTTPGDAMSTIDVQDLGNGKLLLKGTNSAGFTGSGTFAYVNFKIIATGPGSAEFCTIFNPDATPTPTTPSTTIAPTIPGQTVAPTRLPKSGEAPTSIIPLVGIVLLIGATYSLMRKLHNNL